MSGVGAFFRTGCMRWRKRGEPPCCECSACALMAIAFEINGMELRNTHWSQKPEETKP